MINIIKQTMQLTLENLLESSDGILESNIFSLGASENLGNLEGL